MGVNTIAVRSRAWVLDGVPRVWHPVIIHIVRADIEHYYVKFVNPCTGWPLGDPTGWYPFSDVRSDAAHARALMTS